MALKTSSYTEYKRIRSDIKAGKFAPVYFLYGNEDYFIDSLADMIAATAIDEADRDFNQTVVYGSDATREFISGAIRQYPVLAPRRLVMLKEAQAMEDFRALLDDLNSYFAKPSPTTIFVITLKKEKDSAPSAKIAKALKTGGAEVFASTRLWDNQVPHVIREYCDSHRVGIDDDAITLLMEYNGENISNLTAAIDKIMLASAGDKPSRISQEDVIRHVGVNKEYSAFELVSAVARRNYPSMMRMSAYFSRNPKASPTPVTASLLFKFFSSLLVCHYAADKSPRGIAEATGAKSQYAKSVKDIEAGLTNYSAGSCVRIIRAVRDFDAMSKGVGSLRKDTDLQTELMYKIMTL